jgi:hypothetical protein
VGGSDTKGLLFTKKNGRKGGIWVGEKERTKIIKKNGEVRQSVEGGALVVWVV